MHMNLEVIAVTITALVAIITYGQWLTGKNQLKHSLFEKRYAVYEKITGYMAAILINGTVAPGADVEFLRDTKNAYFLFSGDSKVSALISELYEHSINLHMLVVQEKSCGDEILKENLDKQNEIKKWIKDKLSSMELLFEEHLLLEN